MTPSLLLYNNNCVKIKVIEDYSTASFVQAFTRLSCEVGYPKKLLVDEGSQFIKGCQSMIFNFSDIKSQLHRNIKVEFQACLVGGHNMHGRVERKICEMRHSIQISIQNLRLPIIQWKTISSAIANSINNFPLAIGNIKGEFEMADLISPNQLLLGRNNYDKLMKVNKQIFESWFELWLTVYVPNLMPQPKWFSSDKGLKRGDIVLFMKQDSSLCSTYQFGITKSFGRGRNEKIRKVIVQYQNANETTLRETNRATRSLVKIHSIDELDISKELFDLKV